MATAAKTVRCGDCRGLFELSARRELEWRRRGARPVCRECRRAPTVEPTEADRRWWLDRFTVDEIREMGAGLGVGQ